MGIMGKHRVNRCIALLIFFLMAMSIVVAAEDQVIINSKDWQDVYAGMLYAKHKGIDVFYIAEETQGIQLYTEVMSKDKKDVLLIESRTRPFLRSYKEKLEGEGFKVERITTTEPKTTATELTKRLVKEKSINTFIVIDANLGYSAMSVVPYALLTEAGVIFADKDTVEEVEFFLQEQRGSVLLYGHVDREVKDALSGFNPEIIDEGDHYKDNMEMVSRFLEQKKAKQISFTDGEVIETGLFTSEFPTLFIGESNLPQETVDFIIDSGATVGTVTGYDLYDNARRLRELTGIKVLLKYGQGRNEQIYALDIFPLPEYDPKIAISAVRYNTLTKELEVVYRNEGDIFTYLQALTHDIIVNDEVIKSIGDEEAFFLGEGDVIAITYDVDLSEHTSEVILVKSKVAYGESPLALTKLLSQEAVIEIVAIEDNSKIRIKDVVYNKETKRFEIIVENLGEKKVHVDLELIELIIDGEATTVSGEQQAIDTKRSKKFKIKAPLEEIDIEDNPTVKIKARFGQRSDALIKSSVEERPFKIKTGTLKLVLILLLIIILLLLFWRVRKKKEKKHKHHHHRRH